MGRSFINFEKLFIILVLVQLNVILAQRHMHTHHRRSVQTQPQLRQYHGGNQFSPFQQQTQQFQNQGNYGLPKLSHQGPTGFMNSPTLGLRYPQQNIFQTYGNPGQTQYPNIYGGPGNFNNGQPFGMGQNGYQPNIGGSGPGPVMHQPITPPNGQKDTSQTQGQYGQNYGNFENNPNTQIPSIVSPVQQQNPNQGQGQPQVQSGNTNNPKNPFPNTNTNANPGQDQGVYSNPIHPYQHGNPSNYPNQQNAFNSGEYQNIHPATPDSNSGWNGARNPSSPNPNSNQQSINPNTNAYGPNGGNNYQNKLQGNPNFNNGNGQNVQNPYQEQGQGQEINNQNQNNQYSQGQYPSLSKQDRPTQTDPILDVRDGNKNVKSEERRPVNSNNPSPNKNTLKQGQGSPAWTYYDEKNNENYSDADLIKLTKQN